MTDADPRSAFVPQNDPGVEDGASASGAGRSVEVPAQVDYRARPNAGQTAAAAATGGLTGVDDRADPLAGGTPTSPQPEIPNAGYSINAAPARPNAMTLHPAGAPTAAPDPDPTSIQAWDVWETTAGL